MLVAHTRPPKARGVLSGGRPAAYAAACLAILAVTVPATAEAQIWDWFSSGKEARPAAPAAPNDGAGPAVGAPPPVTPAESPEPAPLLPDGAEPVAAEPLPPIAPPVANPELTWRVENPFRLFADPKDTAVHRATFESLAPAERRTPILAAERHLARRIADGWASQVIDETCWDARRNRHVCPKSNEPYAKPQSHAVLARIDGIPEPGLVDCTWMTTPMGGKPRGGSSFVTRCDGEARLEIPYPDGALVEVRIGGQAIARTRVVVEDLFIVGFGDSFASGEGNPDVPVRFSPERAASYTDGPDREDLTGLPARVGGWRTIGDDTFMRKNARWLDQACHRSLYSHQLRAALQLAIENPHRAVTYAGFACSGAEITRGLFLRYKGNEWVPNPPDVSQISAAARLQCGDKPAPLREMPEAYHIKGMVPELEGTVVLHKCPIEDARAIDLVFVSIGGNDIGFARLLANTILIDQSLLRQLGGWLGQVHGLSAAQESLDTLDERFKALNRALHGVLHVPWREPDRIILTAYPEMALLGDGSEVCPSGSAGMEVVSDFSLDQRRAREGVWIADRLNRKMADTARKQGWRYVDSHRDDFIGRGICAGFTQASFSIADDLRLPRKRNGVWTPYNPSEFRAYASRQRWFRTPNDAFMTGNFHVSPSLLQKALKLQQLSWFQVILASTYSGAFHPTAEGHAAMADALVEEARAVLEKYGQGAARRPAGGPFVDH